jgi:tryptophan halogenase
MSQDKMFPRQDDGLPLVRPNFGYHIENRRFVDYLEDMATQRDIALINGVVTGATQDDHGITSVLMESGQSLSADLYIDCSGFRSLLIGQTLKEPYISFKSTLFCDRAIVGSWMRGHDEVIKPYTTAEAMPAGWCWQIEHPDCINRGYVYSSSFISDDEAERDMRAKNPKLGETRIVPFRTGRYERAWVKNVVAIGNAGGFVEPLESTGLAVICDGVRILATCLQECARSPRSSYIRHYNRIFADGWDITRDFLGIHYKFNTRFDTPFWKAAQADTVLGNIQELIDFYQENGPSSFLGPSTISPNGMFGMEGFLALMIGQKVPYRGRYSPTAEEKRMWDLVRANNRMVAQKAVGVREALDLISRPGVKWKEGFFKSYIGTTMTSYVDA